MYGNHMIVRKKPEVQQYQYYGWGIPNFSSGNQQQVWGQNQSGFGNQLNMGFAQPFGFNQIGNNGFGNSNFLQPNSNFGFQESQNIQQQQNNNIGFGYQNNNNPVQPNSNGFGYQNGPVQPVQPNNNGFGYQNSNGFVQQTGKNIQPPFGKPNNNTIGPQINNNGNQGGNFTPLLNPGTMGNIFGNNLQGSKWVEHQQSINKFSLLDGGKFNLAQYIQSQVIEVEPSPQRPKIQEIKKKKGQKYVDNRFPPSENSLSGQWGPQSNWKQIKWVKLSEKFPKGQIFMGKPSPNDIKQGYLGDCYYLAGLAALAQRPDRIFNLFLQTQRNEQQFYSVKILYKGKWVTIDMDQYIPFLYNSPAFTKAVSNSFWVVLLEKAWAKIYTSYKRIQAGYPEEPLHDLTGAPIKQIYVKNQQFNKQQQWKYLLLASSLEYSMVCSSNPGSDSNKSQSGVVQGHAYTLLDAFSLNFDNKQHRLIKLRNPWGKGEFKGQWSDDDPNWLRIDPEQKKRLGFQKAEDGIFFMPYDKFIEQFRTITVAEINDDASYLYKSHKDPDCQGCYFKLDIKKSGTYSLQVDKPPERSLQQKRQLQYSYALATIDIGFYKNGKIQKRQKFSSNSRTTQKKFRLQEGFYLVKVKIDYNVDFEKDYDVNLAVYAQFPCMINYANNQEASLLDQKSVKWRPKQQTSSNSAPQPWNQMACFGWSQSKGDIIGGNKNVEKDNNMVSAMNNKSSSGFQGISSNQIIPGDQVNNTVRPATKSWCCFF